MTEEIEHLKEELSKLQQKYDTMLTVSFNSQCNFLILIKCTKFLLLKPTSRCMERKWRRLRS